MKGCRQCGECCTYLLLPVERDHHEFHRWLRYHGGRIVSYEGRPHVRFEIPCEKYDAQIAKCSIYPSRPQMCKPYYCEEARRRGPLLVEQ